MGHLVPCLHTTDALAALFIPGGFFHRSLNYLPGHHAQHMRYTSACTFFHHYMHRYDLSFGQAGLHGSCIYALRSR